MPARQEPASNDAGECDTWEGAFVPSCHYLAPPPDDYLADDYPAPAQPQSASVALPPWGEPSHPAEMN